MRTIRMAADLAAIPFSEQQALADTVAASELGEPMLLSWYDAARGIESPNGVSECSEAAPDLGVRRYAASRGGALTVEIGPQPACSVFCYLDLAV
jgi:hypothetical protein